MSDRFRMKIRAGETFLYRKGGTESQDKWILLQNTKEIGTNTGGVIAVFV